MMTESRRKSRGFSLVEIAIVLAILGFVLTIGLKSTGAYLSAERRQTTVARLAGVDAALVNYVALQKRLPCPAVGSSAAGVEAGRAANGTCSVAVLNNGVVPWVTLGISEAEAQDGWGNRISYRTANSAGTALTRDNAMDLTKCDPAGTNTTLDLGSAPQNVESCRTPTPLDPTQNSPKLLITGRGLTVQDGSNGVLMDGSATGTTGAAYLLISHGENRAGAYSSSGTIQIGLPPNLPPAVPLILEDMNKNRNDDPGYPAFFIDAPQSDLPGNTQFDDIILRPTVISVATRAGLGPRKP